jgi:hypothetical protein
VADESKSIAIILIDPANAPAPIFDLDPAARPL